MSPVIVFRDDKPYLITGSPGGSTIITSVLQEILNVIDFQMSLGRIFKKSRIHFQHLPDVLFHEEFDKSLIESLKNKKISKRKLVKFTHFNNRRWCGRIFRQKKADGKTYSFYK